MRKEPFNVGSYIHVIKRGHRKSLIVRDENDRNHFERILYYLNHKKSLPERWSQILREKRIKNFDFPKEWGKRKPLVKIVAYALMPNHLHLFLKEIVEGGVTTFMRKIGNSMTAHFNLRHEESGTLFPGAYRSKTIEDDAYFRYCGVYIMVKNIFELYPGGLERAKKEFEIAFQWALNYRFSSLPEYLNIRTQPIIDKELLGELFFGPKDFKDFARDCILGRKPDFNEINLE